MALLKASKILVLVIVILCMSSNAIAEERIWVAITEPSSEYQVQLPVSTVRAITEGTFDKPYIHLKNVYWWVEEDKTVVSQAEGGKQSGYSSDVYVRVSHISRIIPLSDEHVAKHKLGTQGRSNTK